MTADFRIQFTSGVLNVALTRYRPGTTPLMVNAPDALTSVVAVPIMNALFSPGRRFRRARVIMVGASTPSISKASRPEIVSPSCSGGDAGNRLPLNIDVGIRPQRSALLGVHACAQV